MSRAAASRRDGWGGIELKRIKQQKASLQVYVASRPSAPSVLQPHSYTHIVMPSLVFPSVLQSFSVTHRFVSLPLLHAMRHRIISRALVIIIVLVFAFALFWSSSSSSIIIPIVRFVCVILALLHAQRHNMHPHGERNCAACTLLKEASFGIRNFAQVLCRDIRTPFRWANVLWLFETLKR